MRKQIFQIVNLRLDFFMLFFNLPTFQRRQTTQLHIQNGLSLDFGQLEAVDQVLLGFVNILRFADGLDHSVNIFQSDQQSIQNVDARPRFGQFMVRTPHNDRLAMFDKDHQCALERQQSRLAIHQRQHLHTKSRLQHSVLIKLVQHSFWLRAAFQFDHDAHTPLIGLIPQVRDHIEFAAAGMVCDAFDQTGFVHLIRDFRDHNLITIVFCFLDVGLSAHHDTSFAGCVGRFNPLPPDNNAACREVGPGDALHQFFQGDVIHPVIVLNQIAERIYQLSQVV